MEVKEIIVSAFKKSGQPMRPGEIAEISGLDKQVVEKEIKKMKTDGLVFSPKRCFYNLTK